MTAGSQKGSVVEEIRKPRCSQRERADSPPFFHLPFSTVPIPTTAQTHTQPNAMCCHVLPVTADWGLLPRDSWGNVCSACISHGHSCPFREGRTHFPGCICEAKGKITGGIKKKNYSFLGESR